MQKVFDFSGAGDFCPGGTLYPNPKESNILFSLGQHVDVCFRYRKRSRISAPFVFRRESPQEKLVSIDVLPDECLFEVFRRLPGQERSACACVSKHWLMLLGSIRRGEICASKSDQSVEAEEKVVPDKVVDPSEVCKKGEITDKAEAEVQYPESEGDGYLSRCLEGKKATDVRLAAMAVGTGSRGGLGKLSIRGGNSSHGVTNLGLKAVARGCPSLRVLSLWNVPSVGDEGLIEIANECNLLEKLDLCQCPAISDKSLLAIAEKCPNLTSLTIESCAKIGNESLQAVGNCCPKLASVSIKNCPLVGDRGIATLFSSASFVLTKVKLQALNISDVSLAVIGHYGKAVIDLALTGLQNVTERGFWVMGNGQGLQKLRTFVIASCQGVTDVGIEAVAKGCPNLKQFYLRKCASLSDNGLVSFAKVAGSLESLQLEKCHRITQVGLLGTLVNCSGKLKSFALASCLGIKDVNYGFPLLHVCNSLRSFSIHNCPGFGNGSLAIVGRLCPQLQHVELIGLQGITDVGFIRLIEGSDGLVKVNVGGCVNLTDKLVSAITESHGGTLEVLNIEGCKYITNASLAAIAQNCSLLSELDVSHCAITDTGIATLASAIHLNILVLSLSGCTLLSDKCLPFLSKLGQSLMGLNIQHCRGISSGTVDQLVEQLWRCDILT